VKTASHGRNQRTNQPPPAQKYAELDIHIRLASDAARKRLVERRRSDGVSLAVSTLSNAITFLARIFALHNHDLTRSHFADFGKGRLRRRENPELEYFAGYGVEMDRKTMFGNQRSELSRKRISSP